MEEAEKEAYVNSSAIPLGIVLLFYIAIRDGELCGLKWKDIELYKGKQVIHIQRQLVVNHNLRTLAGDPSTSSSTKSSKIPLIG